MSTAKTNVLIGRKKVDPYRLTIQQKFDDHHSFEMAVAAEKIEGKNSLSIDKSMSYIGESIEVALLCGGNTLKFKGIITNIRLDRTYAGDSLVIFSGYSPTYLLEDGISTKSYEEKGITGIVNEIFNAYPANLLNPVVAPKYAKTIPYVVRYKETNYQFLSRIAALYGEWFYYDGRSVVFGALPNSSNIELTLGKDLMSFDYGVELRPSNSAYQGYKYEENRVLKNSTKSFTLPGLDTHGKKAQEVSDKIFPNEQVNPIRHYTKDDAHIKYLAEAKKSAILSDATSLKGQSYNAGVVVGGRIGLNAFNKVGSKNVPGFIGRFRVTSVTHELDANKDYTNRFEAIPVAITAPPINKNVQIPEAESQVAVVIDNHDPEGLGRIRAQFKWQDSNEMTPWIRVLTSSASGGRGMYFIPEIGDEAYIDFDQGNPDRPYVTGTLFHGKAKPIWGSAGNDTKALRTRSGSRVELNDADGSVNIIDPSGNTVSMAGNGEITITAPNKVTIISNDIMVDAANDLTLKAGNNITIEAGNDFTKTVGNNIASSAGNSIEALAASAVQMVGSSLINLNSGGSSVINLLAGGFAEMSGSSEISIDSGGCWGGSSSSGFDINGGSGVKVCGPEVGING